MATAKNRRRLATFIDEKCEEQPRSNLAQNTIFPRSQEDYITLVSEEIEDRVRKKLSNEFNRMQSRISAALSQLDDFPLNPLIQNHSRSSQETSRNALGTNQGTIEDDSQSDFHPEATVSQSQTMQKSGPDDGYDRWLKE